MIHNSCFPNLLNFGERKYREEEKIWPKGAKDSTQWPWGRTITGVFPTSQLLHISKSATLATMACVSSSYSLSEEAKPWPWPTLQRKTFGCCACAKSFHLRLTRKRWQKVRSGGKKAGKKCHSTRTRGKVGPTQHAGPKVGPKNIYYFQTPWKLVQRTKWAPSAFKFLQPSGASILYWNSAEA